MAVTNGKQLNRKTNEQTQQVLRTALELRGWVVARFPANQQRVMKFFYSVSAPPKHRLNFTQFYNVDRVTPLKLTPVHHRHINFHPRKCTLIRGWSIQRQNWETNEQAKHVGMLHTVRERRGLVVWMGQCACAWRGVKSSQRAAGKKIAVLISQPGERVRYFPSQQGATRIFSRAFCLTKSREGEKKGSPWLAAHGGRQEKISQEKQKW